MGFGLSLLLFTSYTVTPQGLDATEPEPPRPGRKALTDQADSKVVIRIKKTVG